MKYIQSFYQYAVTFPSIGLGIPSKDADGDLRNIAELTDEQYEKLEKSEPMFRELVRQKKYRVLNKLPESYKPAATLINEARAEAEELRAELAALKAEKAESEEEDTAETENSTVAIEDMSYKELQALAKEKGIENVNQKKEALIEAIKACE